MKIILLKMYEYFIQIYSFLLQNLKVVFLYDKSVKTLLRNKKQPELSRDEIEKIDLFWGRYGIKFRDYGWFQWYYGITGIKDPRFITKSVYKVIFLNMFNDQKLVSAWKDKCYFEQFLPMGPFPKTIFKKVNGRYYDKDGVFVPSDNINKILENCLEKKDIIFKLNNERQGKGVLKFHIDNLEEARKIIFSNKDKKSYIVQEEIKQHPFFAQFNDSSVNIMRIYTLYLNNRVEIMDNVVIRYGMPGKITDVCYEDGKEIVRCVCVGKDGQVLSCAVDMDGNWDDVDRLFDIKINRVPNWDKVIETVKKCALQIPYFSYIGWDVTVDDNEQPIIIEYNITTPGEIMYQYRNPLLGDFTEEVFAPLLSKENQIRYIPWCLRK